MSSIKDYVFTKPKIYIKYHMNNLYGKAMMEPLPDGEFKWIKVNDKTINTVLNKINNSKYGCFLEVALVCSKKRHDIQNYLSMVPEKIKVTQDMLSPLQLEMKNKYDIKVGFTKKLIPNLLSKKNYVVHYRNLKYYLANGWKLTKVHAILKFKQSAWMKLYIEFNIEKRMQATNEADKNFFKLMINSVYGKTMENMKKRMKIRIATNKEDLLKYASRPTFINHIIYAKNLVAIHKKPQTIKLNKPIYVGCTVLELSNLMCKFWFDFIKKRCNNVKLIYMDTDSFIFEVIGENSDEIMLENKEYFDLSNFPKDSKYFCNENKKVPGKMKDEYAEKNIYEVIAIKPKSYTIICENNQEKCTCKGHNANFTSNEYKDVQNNTKILTHEMCDIVSKKHNLFTQKKN